MVIVLCWRGVRGTGVGDLELEILGLVREELSLSGSSVINLEAGKPRNWASGFRVDPGLDRVGLGRVRGAGVWVGSGRPSCKPG